MRVDPHGGSNAVMKRTLVETSFSLFPSPSLSNITRKSPEIQSARLYKILTPLNSLLCLLQGKLSSEWNPLDQLAKLTTTSGVQMFFDNKKETGSSGNGSNLQKYINRNQRQLKMKRNPYTLSLIVVVPESAVCFLSRNEIKWDEKKTSGEQQNQEIRYKAEGWWTFIILSP